MQEQEYVITSNLVPRSPFSHLASDRPPSVDAQEQEPEHSLEESPPPQDDIEEDPLNFDISSSHAYSSSSDSYEPTIEYSASFVPFSMTPSHVIITPPPERMVETLRYEMRVRDVAQTMPQPSSMAEQVANRVINYARMIRHTREEDLSCLICGYFPSHPITGPCGHTNCAKCIAKKDQCPCGCDAPEIFQVNILIRDLIQKATAKISTYRAARSARNRLSNGRPARSFATSSITRKRLERVSELQFRHGAIRRTLTTRAHAAIPFSSVGRRIPISLRSRYNYALELLGSKRYWKAAPLLALAAGSSQPEMREARKLLAQVIMVLSKGRDPRQINRQLNRAVRQLTSASWLKLRDLECILCCDPFTNPVTTPCGHVFCRICIERTMDYGKRCPLCVRSLRAFDLSETGETVFIEAALALINALNVPAPPESDMIPIFVCTVAYPSVSCPLFIFDPRYWLMIRRVLESGSRKFGMLFCGRDYGCSNIGTILEVRDCVHFEDGRSLLSTVGLSRFRVMDISVREGCEVARISPITDVPPIDYRRIFYLKMMANEVLLKAFTWLMQINSDVLEDIETTFGELPREDLEEDWWETPDGPAWLWWLVAVLPLRTEIKVLILSTDCLLKRMMAVSRTLDSLMLTTSQ